VARDSEGRTRHEQTLNAVGPWSSAGEGVTTIFINDPVAGVNYVLDPRTRTARKMALPRLSLAPGGSFGAGAAAGAAAARAEDGRATAAAKSIQRVSGGVLQGSAIRKVQPPYPPVAKAARASGAVQVQVLVGEDGQVVSADVVSGHPLLREAALTAARQWVFRPTELSGVPVKVQGILTFNFTLGDSGNNEAGMQERRSVLAQPKTESLGKEMVEGVQAEGTRTTITIPAGAIGNEWPIDIIEERWYSPELQTTVKTRHHDPRTGETTFRLTNINRSEPPASLFEVPSDYTIRDEPASFARERMLELEKMRKPENE
jgi:TonB family protein